MINEIINIAVDDNAIIEVINISKIRTEDEYGGFRVILCVKIENMREHFQIDIATGDLITPGAIEYSYLPTLGDSYINVWVYNIETVLAEKIEIILSRAEASSRIRDYYDIYLIYTKNWDNIDKKIFRTAINKTFTQREYNGNVQKTFELIKNSSILRSRWESYSKKYNYAHGIKYDDVLKCVEQVIEVFIPVAV